MKHYFWLYLVLGLIACPPAAEAQDNVRAAVAAGYIHVMQEIAAAYELKTGVKVETAFSSSGNLYNQIVNGAPYDIYLSADQDRPNQLHRSHLAIQPFVYARGELILWSAKKNFCRPSNWQDAALAGHVKRIAIINPAVGPYGEAAMAAIKKMSDKDTRTLTEKLILGQNMNQAFQYATSEAVEAAFVSLSFALMEEGAKGCFYRIPQAPLVIHGACVLTNKNSALAEQFAAFLISEKALKIRQKYGYQ
jgi:molybdate transport system substrate-binding protein